MATFITPPENQGQIVEVSYASTEECAYQRVIDRSDRSVVIRRLFWVDLYPTPDGEEIDFEPWNREPSIPGEIWAEAEIVTEDEIL